MGILDFFNLQKKQTENKDMNNSSSMTSMYTPAFSQFGDNIHASDVVQQAITCVTSEIKKLTPMHVTRNGPGDVEIKKGLIQKYLKEPNPLMTTGDLLEKITWNYFFNYNSFILPTYEIISSKEGVKTKRYTGIYPLSPINVEFIEDGAGNLYTKMRFQNGTETTLLYSDLIHIRKNYSVNEYMGGNESGQPDNGNLLKTLKLNDELLQGVSKAMKSTLSINGVVKYKTLIDKRTTEKAVAKLEQQLIRGESGLMGLDMQGEFVPIKRDVKFVDEATLKFIDEKILRHFGVPLPILTGDYTKEQYEAFYQKTLEPIILSYSQAFTKCFFGNKLQFGVSNHEIVFYAKDLIFMSMDQKLELVRNLGDSGALYENEKRTILGLPPIPELEGKRKQSLNYVDVEIANTYQLGQSKKNKLTLPNKAGNPNVE